jgi:hypothetical protein
VNGESSIVTENLGTKRKLEDTASSSSQPSKKLAVEPGSINLSSTSAAAAVNQKVKEHLVNRGNKAKKSEAIRSIYKEKKDKDVTESYLVRGTFNRYAA